MIRYLIIALTLLTPLKAHAETNCWEWAEGMVSCTDDEGNETNCWEWAEGYVTCE
jgi:hypothetical protein